MTIGLAAVPASSPVNVSGVVPSTTSMESTASPDAPDCFAT
jgi:hypothetical protein